ncbi:MAG: nucleoside triphosphate pyrophosphohydrolase [Verrucomicrobiales bacterium]
MATPRLPDDQITNPPDGLPGMDRLRALMHRLRAPGGCPWDARQTHESLIPNLIEETYEVVDTIRRGDEAHLKEELGDLLLQVVFHSELAEETGVFDFDQVAHSICDKLVHRHPHVFGDAVAGDPDAVLRQWDAIKRAEKGREEAPWLDGTGDGLPALMKAAKLQKKAAKIGFDWPDAASVVAKIHEEIAELENEYRRDVPEAARIDDELGDLLFSVVNLIRKDGRDPEALLAAANAKFMRRFHAMEVLLRDDGIALDQAGPERLEQAWDRAKREEE